jgi:hypothetical protein
MIPIQFTNADDNDSYIDHRQLELPAIPARESFLTLDGKSYRVGYADWTIWSNDEHQTQVRVSLYPIRPNSN